MIISLNDVSKGYWLGAKRASLRDAVPEFFKVLGRRIVGRGGRSPHIWALKDVSFEVQRGEVLGIIGANGAGKTTILKLLAGVSEPTSGRVKVDGKVAALIELGAGFHPDLTGRENVYLNGSILGMKKRELDEEFESIVSFSELGRFIDTPVKRYSSGMYVRLGFAIAAHVPHDILLVDEVLAVGDASFRRKCLSRIADLKRGKKTIVFVSHDLGSVRSICDRVIWLGSGKIEEDGEPSKVCRDYSDWALMQPLSAYRGKRWGTGEVKITKVRLLNKEDEETNVFKTGDSMSVEIQYDAAESVAQPNFGVSMFREGQYISGTNTFIRNFRIDEIAGSGKIRMIYDDLHLLSGVYELSVGICQKESWQAPYDLHERCYQFVVESAVKDEGVVFLEGRWKVK